MAAAIPQDVRNLLILLGPLHPQRHIAHDEDVEHDPEPPDVLLLGPSGNTDVRNVLPRCPARSLAGDVSAMSLAPLMSSLRSCHHPEPDRLVDHGEHAENGARKGLVSSRAHRNELDLRGMTSGPRQFPITGDERSFEGLCECHVRSISGYAWMKLAALNGDALAKENLRDRPFTTTERIVGLVDLADVERRRLDDPTDPQALGSDPWY